MQDVLFYALPEHAHYYSEILNLLESDGLRAAASHATTCALYCKYDLMRLERVVGGSRARKMVSAESAHFMFC